MEDFEDTLEELTLEDAYNLSYQYVNALINTDTKDNKNINDCINEFIEYEKSLEKNSNKDKVFYYAARLLNKLFVLLSITTIMEGDELQKLFKSVNNEISFEKEALTTINKYCKNCKKTKNYDYLPLAFSMLIAIDCLQEARENNVKVEKDRISLKLNDIEYIPVIDENTNNLKLTIEENIQKLNTYKK